MLNKLTFPPAHPWRAKPRRFPRFILGSSISSTYPSVEELPGRSGKAGEDYYTTSFLSPAASLGMTGLSILRDSPPLDCGIYSPCGPLKF